MQPANQRSSLKKFVFEVEELLNFEVDRNLEDDASLNVSVLGGILGVCLGLGSLSGLELSACLSLGSLSGLEL